MLLFLNATNDWTKSKLFLPPHPGNQQSHLQNIAVRRMLYETRACIYNKRNKRMLFAQDCVKFRGCRARAYRMTEISFKQLCWFPECTGKNNLDFVPSLVAFGIRNICYYGGSCLLMKYKKFQYKMRTHVTWVARNDICRALIELFVLMYSICFYRVTVWNDLKILFKLALFFIIQTFKTALIF